MSTPDEPTRPHDMARELDEVDPDITVHPIDLDDDEDRVTEDER